MSLYYFENNHCVGASPRVQKNKDKDNAKNGIDWSLKNHSNVDVNVVK